MQLAIENLPKDIQEEKIKSLIGEFGEILKFELARDESRDSCRAWVEMDEKGGQAILSHLNKEMVMGHTLKITQLYDKW